MGIYLHDPAKSRTILTKSLNSSDLEDALVPNDIFTYHTVVDERTGHEYEAYVEPWYWDCISEREIREAKEECEDDDDCLDEYLWGTVEDEASRRVKKDRWDTFVHTSRFDKSDFGETVFLRRKR